MGTQGNSGSPDKERIQGAQCQRRGVWQPLSEKGQGIGKNRDILRLSQGWEGLSCCLKVQVLPEVG